MARLLLAASFLQRSVLSPEIFRQGLLGTLSQLSNFSTKGRKKSVASASGDENLSKKDLALKQAIEQIKASFGSGAIRWLGRAEKPTNTDDQKVDAASDLDGENNNQTTT